MRLLGKYWVLPPFVWGLCAVELLLTIAVLAIFGIADPNTYRTKLWQEGSDHGWNSNPNEILYSYANHNPMKTPTVWSSWLNTYNVVISVLSMFFLLTKSTMLFMHIWFPFLSILVHLALVALYCYSAYAQASPDTSDPTHPQTGPPWYITKSCSVSSTDEIKGYCEQAKAAFALTIVMIVLFAVNLVWAIYSSFFGKKPPREEEEDDDDYYRPSIYDPQKGFSQEDVGLDEQQVQMNRLVPQAYSSISNVPYTPRTQAFQKLGGESTDLPLRQA